MKMLYNRYTRFIPLLCGLVFIQSCTKNFEAINTNPDAVSQPTPQYIFSKALYDGVNFGGNTESLLLGHMQYFTSYNDVAGFGSKYVAAQQAQSSSVFANAYTNQINELIEVIKAVKSDPALVNLYASARIWKVFCFSRITDLYGDIPYSQAAKGYTNSVFQPAYDAQKDIYADLLKELDESAVSLTASNTNTFGSSDLLYTGNVPQWKKFAYSLMLRLAMRMTKVDAAAAQSWVNKAVAGGVILNYTDIAKVSYTNAGQDINRNPMALTMLNSNYNQSPPGLNNTEGGKFQQVFIDSLKANNDPRLSVFSVVYVGGVANNTPSIQKGMPATISGGKPADFITYSEPNKNTLIRIDAPILVFTAAESYFLLAEAALKGWYTAESASSLYEKGVRAALQHWDLISGTTGTITGTQADAYVTAHPITGKGASVDNQTEQIYTQFWLGIFPDAQEVFNNFRRTGYPKLIPNNYPGNATNGQFFRRFLYPVIEQTLNTTSYNAAVSRQGADAFLTRIWWDKQ